VNLLYLPGRRRLLQALIGSLLLHLAVLIFPLAPAAVPRAYPPPLSVLLPNSADNRIVHLEREPPLPVSEQRRADPEARIVELTPAPKDSSNRREPTVFLPVSALSVKPRLLNPDWLDEAWTLPPQASGRVTVSIEIDENGGIHDVYAENAASELADWIVPRIRERAKFSPGERGGVPVPSRVRVELDLQALSGK